jgi:hypothetical protein
LESTSTSRSWRSTAVPTLAPAARPRAPRRRRARRTFADLTFGAGSGSGSSSPPIAVEPWLEDLTRRARLGLDGTARRLGLGVLLGCSASATTEATTSGCYPGRPTFPGEAAESVLRTLTDVGIELTDAELSGVVIDGG